MVKRWGAVIHPQELSERWLARMGEAGITVLGLHPVGGIHAADSLAEMIEDEFLPERQRLYQMARGMGIAIEYEMHALSYLLPRRLFGAHPEWFRMDESGKRTADFNLCVSDLRALAYLEKRAEVLAGIFRPDSDRYYFWLDDVSGYRCHCPLCRDLSASDQQLLAVNALQRGIRRANPSGRMAYIAYVDALQPPRGVKPEPGVFLEYAPFRRNSSRPIDDPDCPENAAQIEHIAPLMDFFGREGSQVLEYWADNSRFSGWKKPPKQWTLNENVMRRDVAYYQDMGFETLTGFACYLGEDYVELYGEPLIKRYGELLHGCN